MPKNVATNSAPRLRAAAGPTANAGALLSALFGIVLALSALAVALCHQRFEFFRVRHRCGDHIAPAGPFAEIDHAAALGTERELRVAAQNELAAYRTTQARDSLAWHTSIVSAARITLCPSCNLCDLCG